MQVLCLSELYISYANAINLPLSLQKRDKMVAEEALLDSGATENFIDY